MREGSGHQESSRGVRALLCTHLHTPIYRWPRNIYQKKQKNYKRKKKRQKVGGCAKDKTLNGKEFCRILSTDRLAQLPTRGGHQVYIFPASG